MQRGRARMGAVTRLGLIAAFAVVTAGCGQGSDAGSKQSVTVKLAPPRPYKPDPGFSLATDMPGPADAQTPPRS